LDLDFKFLKPFGLWLDLDCVLEIQDWIWTAKYGSPGYWLVLESRSGAKPMEPLGVALHH